MQSRRSPYSTSIVTIVPMNSICQTKEVTLLRTLAEARSEQRPASSDILALSQITCPSQLRLEFFQLPSPTRARPENVASGHWHDTILVECVRTISRALRCSNYYVGWPHVQFARGVHPLGCRHLNTQGVTACLTSIYKQQVEQV